MKKRFTIGILIALVLILSVVSSVLAAGVFTKQVNGNVIVLQAMPGLTFYTDPAATTELTALPMGSIYQGQTTETTTIYVKNTGMLNFTNVNLAFNLGNYFSLITSENSFPLAVNEVKQVDLSISTLPSTTPSNWSFILTASGNYE